MRELQAKLTSREFVELMVYQELEQSGGKQTVSAKHWAQSIGAK